MLRAKHMEMLFTVQALKYRGQKTKTSWKNLWSYEQFIIKTRGHRRGMMHPFMIRQFESLKQI